MYSRWTFGQCEIRCILTELLEGTPEATLPLHMRPVTIEPKCSSVFSSGQHASCFCDCNVQIPHCQFFSLSFEAILVSAVCASWTLVSSEISAVSQSKNACWYEPRMWGKADVHRWRTQQLKRSLKPGV